MYQPTHLFTALCVASACSTAAFPASAVTPVNKFRIGVPNLAVTAATAEPSLTVALSGGTLTAAVAGVPYSAALQPRLAVTGDAAYSGEGVSWSVVSDSLPAGLLFTSDGYIRGTALASGNGAIQVAATYKNKTAYATYQISVAPLTATSCKDLLQKNPETPSGWYPLDVDEAGPENEAPYYCDMSSSGGGWTRIVWQHESSPVTSWAGGANGNSYVLAQGRIPAHTEVGFGKDSLATDVDYVAFQYTTGNIPATLVSGKKTGATYHINRAASNYYNYHNPEEVTSATDVGWKNTLTFDKAGGRHFTWAFSPNTASAASRGYAYGGAQRSTASDAFGWSVWVR